MEVNRKNFFLEMADIMEAISSSHAVCIDLEMSGISTNTQGEDKVKMTLGDAYKKAKEAAEVFTILQVGITCVSWDEQAKEYVTKTYNIPLAPHLVGDDQVSNELARKVERHVRFSSQSISFLLANNFSLDSVFEQGVPYLSVAEVGQSRLGIWTRDMDLTYQDQINIRELPEETQNFCRVIQTKIQEWIIARKFGEDRAKTLVLTSPYGGRFSRIQKRLIHQIVDTNFFENRVHSKQGSMCMEVSLANTKAEKNNGRILAQRSQALMKLTGFRFIWDALSGEPFASSIDPEAIVGQDSNAIIALRARLLACEAKLHRRRPIVVAHNALHDLCFLFQTFNGKLPATVREFQELVRSKLGKLVDTKYLFTRGDHEMMPDRNLEECFHAVQGEKGLSIRAESDKYGYKKAMPHQAGYDSYMTAIVFFKKAYQLSQSPASLKIVPHEDGGVVAPNTALRIPNSHSDPRVRRGAATKSLSLMDDDDDDDNLAHLAKKFEPLKPMAASISVPAIRSNIESSDEDERKGGGQIPEWDDGVFWKRYGNKVRVGVPAMFLYTGY